MISKKRGRKNSARNLLSNLRMKRATFKLAPGKGGWIRTTIAPLNDKREARFGVMDVLMFFTLVTVVVAIARVLIAR